MFCEILQGGGDATEPTVEELSEEVSFFPVDWQDDERDQDRWKVLPDESSRV